MPNEVMQSEVDRALEALDSEGYTMIEGLLDDEEIDALREVAEKRLERQRTDRYDPGEGPTHPDDESIEQYVRTMYDTAPPEELDRVLRLFRYNRAGNYDTPVAGADRAGAQELHPQTRDRG